MPDPHLISCISLASVFSYLNRKTTTIIIPFLLRVVVRSNIIYIKCLAKCLTHKHADIQKANAFGRSTENGVRRQEAPYNGGELGLHHL